MFWSDSFKVKILYFKHELKDSLNFVCSNALCQVRMCLPQKDEDQRMCSVRKFVSQGVSFKWKINTGTTIVIKNCVDLILALYFGKNVLSNIWLMRDQHFLIGSWYFWALYVKYRAWEQVLLAQFEITDQDRFRDQIRVDLPYTWEIFSLDFK